MIDANEFERRARNPALTQDQLETLKANALSKGNNEFAAIANDVLLERFPIAAKKSGGATPTTAVFVGKVQDFKTGKDAYLWLVERLRNHRSGLLESQDHWHQRAFKGTSRRYFARAPKELFPLGSKLSEQAGNVAELVGGWYANTNLNHEQKFEILIRLAAICRVSYPEDWDFRVTGASIALAEKQAMVVLANQLLEELRDL